MHEERPWEPGGRLACCALHTARKPSSAARCSCFAQAMHAAGIQAAQERSRRPHQPLVPGNGIHQPLAAPAAQVAAELHQQRAARQLQVDANGAVALGFPLAAASRVVAAAAAAGAAEGGGCRRGAAWAAGREQQLVACGVGWVGQVCKGQGSGDASARSGAAARSISAHAAGHQGCSSNLGLTRAERQGLRRGCFTAACAAAAVAGPGGWPRQAPPPRLLLRPPASAACRAAGLQHHCASVRPREERHAWYAAHRLHSRRLRRWRRRRRCPAAGAGGHADGMHCHGRPQAVCEQRCKRAGRLGLEEPRVLGHWGERAGLQEAPMPQLGCQVDGQRCRPVGRACFHAQSSAIGTSVVPMPAGAPAERRPQRQPRPRLPDRQGRLTATLRAKAALEQPRIRRAAGGQPVAAFEHAP